MVKGTTEFWDIETQVFVATTLERFFFFFWRFIQWY